MTHNRTRRLTRALLATLAVTAAAPATAQAQTPPPVAPPATPAAQPAPTAPLAYANIGLGSMVPVSDRDTDLGFGAVFARVGTGLSRTGLGRFFAVEGEAGFGYGEDTEEAVFNPIFDSFVSSRQTYEADAMFGVFAVARAPFANRRGHAFLRLGYGSHSYSLESSTTVGPNPDGIPESTQTASRDFSLAGPALGFGAEGFWGPERRNGVRFDLLAVADPGGERVDTDLFLDGSSSASLAYVRRF